MGACQNISRTKATIQANLKKIAKMKYIQI